MTIKKKRAKKKIAVDHQRGKIYKLVNTENQMLYIGSTASTLVKRLYEHKSSAKTGTSTSNIYTSMRLIGIEKFSIILIKLFPCTCKAELDAEEYRLTNEYPKNELYNSMFNGAPTLEVIEKIKESIKAHPQAGRFAEESPNFKRGCISHVSSRNMYQFVWGTVADRQTKSYMFGKKRSRQQAYWLCHELQDEIYPLTTKNYLAELPFSEENAGLFHEEG